MWNLSSASPELATFVLTHSHYFWLNDGWKISLLSKQLDEYTKQVSEETTANKTSLLVIQHDVKDQDTAGNN